MNSSESLLEEKSTLLSARDVLPVIVLIISLVITFKLSEAAKHNAEREIGAAFDARVRESNSLIHQRMETYQQVLRGAVGVFAASDSVTREEFREYFDTLKLEENFPGIQALAFGPLVPASQKEAHIRAMRKQGYADYDIRPEGERDLYAPVAYIEPFAGLNARALGFDMFSEEKTREVMEQALRTGKPIATGKLNLAQEAAKDPQYGFLIYLPVYRQVVSQDSSGEGREKFLGWVYAPFRMNDLMWALRWERAGGLDIEIYDGYERTDAALMYDSDARVSPADPPGNLTRIDRIEFGSHQWLVASTALPAFGQQSVTDRAALILRSGIIIGLLLALLLWAILDGRARAIRTAQQATRLALYDALTGLPNRKLVTERLSQAFANAKREGTQIAFLFIDLDKFKPVNDEYGHAVGDLLLKEVGKRLRMCIRESDTAGRLGGDEFVVMLPDVDGKRGAKTAADKILHALTQPFDIAGLRLTIAGSIGVAIYPENGRDQNSLIKSADQAMYEAKNSGRSTVRFAG